MPPKGPSQLTGQGGIGDNPDVELTVGSLPRKQHRLVKAWAEMHQGELLLDWERLQEGELPLRIAPLRQG